MQTQFFTQISKDKEVDAKRYWQFREFYSLGNFSFDPQIVTFGETQKIVALPDQKNVLLTYESPRLKSTDFIMKVDPNIPAQDALQDQLKPYDEMYGIDESSYINETTRLYRLNEGKSLLVFSKSIHEMKSANGFFDYVGSEMELLENTVWVNETEIW